MRKQMAAVLLVLLMLSGCVAKPEQTEPASANTAQTETAPPETVQEPAEGTEATEPTFLTIPEQVVTPGEMPEPPEGDAQLPPQPGSDVITE